MDILNGNALSTVMIFWLIITAGCSALIVYTDIAFYWIPDKAAAFFAICNGLALTCGLVHPDAMITILIAGGFCIIYAVKPDSVGSGDVKLVLALCLGCNDYGAYFMILIAFLTALAGGFVLRMVKGKTILPFGPYLLAGWWLALGFEKELEVWFAL